jgi:steroid 5-alpha reductase family enzyme
LTVLDVLAISLRVSGVTLLEKSLKDAKPGYKEYVPWFPTKKTKTT